jgi:hypothetical protein
MTGTDWKRERLAELRTRIRIEEAILRSLRAELEEIQWLNRESAEMRCYWDFALTEAERTRRRLEEECIRIEDEWNLIWLAGEHNLKAMSPDVPAEAL